ncbi:hypothetical protein ACVWWR_007741 [Bradyrhizobium sp. LM3.2]
MRFDHQKAFPYPVLRPHVDDYLDSEFQVSVDFSGAKNNAKVDVKISVALSSAEIKKQVEKGNAAVSVIFACRETYFRQAVTTQKFELKKSFDSSSFKGEVIIYPFVVATKPIQRFGAKDINKEFRKDSFEFAVGEVLAADEPKVIYIDRELFKPVSSILQIVKDDNLSGFEWRIHFDEDKLQVLLSAEAKEVIDKARNTKRNQAVLLNSIYFAAIMEAIQRLKEEPGLTRRKEMGSGY